MNHGEHKWFGKLETSKWSSDFQPRKKMGSELKRLQENLAEDERAGLRAPRKENHSPDSQRGLTTSKFCAVSFIQNADSQHGVWQEKGQVSRIATD